MHNVKTEQETAAFWDLHPCDGQAGFAARAAVRSNKLPWLAAELTAIARRHPFVVEIGCGQGTDCFAMCAQMADGGGYIALDRSPGSIRSAQSALKDASLRVIPTFVIGDAMRLPFHAGTVECFYSMGVLHHASDTQQGIDEIHRSLKPGGIAYIFLYRSSAIKVSSALLIRRFQAAFGVSLLPLASMLGDNTALGTMLHECFGVPVLRAYSQREARDLFSAFSDASVEQRHEFWLIRATK